MTKYLIVCLIVILYAACSKSSVTPIEYTGAEPAAQNKIIPDAALENPGSSLESLTDKRKVMYKNYKALPMLKSGNVSVKVCVNRTGVVIYTEILQAESSIKDRDILKKCLSAIKEYKFESDQYAPKEQCGKLNIKFDISRF